MSIYKRIRALARYLFPPTKTPPPSPPLPDASHLAAIAEEYFQLTHILQLGSTHRFIALEYRQTFLLVLYDDNEPDRRIFRLYMPSYKRVQIGALSLLYTPDRGAINITEFTVIEPLQRLGIGTLLWQTALQCCPDFMSHPITATFPFEPRDLQGTTHFFAKLGFLVQVHQYTITLQKPSPISHQ